MARQDIDTEEDWIRAELMAGEMARLDSWERGSQAGVPI